MRLYLLHHLPQSVDVTYPPTNTNRSELRPLRVSSLHGRDHVKQLLLGLRVEGPRKVACGEACHRKDKRERQRTNEISPPQTNMRNAKQQQKTKKKHWFH